MKLFFTCLLLLTISGCKMYNGTDPMNWHLGEVREEFIDDCQGIVIDKSEISNGRIFLDMTCNPT